MPRRHTKDAGLFNPGEELPFATLDTRGDLVVGGVTVGVEL